MIQKFQPGVRFNHNFGVLEILSFVCEGVGAALFVFSKITGQLSAAVAGLVLVGAAAAILIIHLGRPERGWRAIARPRTSWVSRGTLAIPMFISVGALSILDAYFRVLPRIERGIDILALVLAGAVLLYAGMLLRSIRAIRFWRGPYMPLSFAAHSLATSSTIAWALAWLSSRPVVATKMAPVAIALVLASAAISALHLRGTERSVGEQASLFRLLHGDLRGRFLGRATAFGVLVPLAVLILSFLVSPADGGGMVAVVWSVAALCRLYGDVVYRVCIVTAGAYEPIFARSRVGRIATTSAMPG